MISTLVAAAGLATPLLLAGPLPAQTSASDVELVARVTATRFVAVNAGEHLLLLRFGSPRAGVVASRLLTPGAGMDEPFPLGTLEDLYFEVLVMNPKDPRSSGALSLEDMAVPRATLWVEPHGHGLEAWLRSPDGDAHLLATFGSLAPVHPALRAQRLGKGPPLPHVPVPTPGEEAVGNRPPRLEKRPPPPV